MPVHYTNTSDEQRIEIRIASVSSRLTRGLREMLKSLPNQPQRAKDIQRALGVKKDVASRIVRATDQMDPLAAALLMPGPAPLRHMMDAARMLRVTESILEPIDRAVDDFERLIRDEIGDRMAFDGVVSSMLPEARERQGIFCRQSVYRGISQIKGASAEVMLNTAVIWPSEQAGYMDGAWLLGWYGLRRMRPGAAIRFTCRMIGTIDSPAPFQSLRGEDVTRPGQVILAPHSSIGEEDIHIQRVGRATHYVLGGDRVGAASSVNITVANFTPSCLSTYTVHEEPRSNGPTMEISTPCRLAVLDVLIHRDALPEVDPTLLVYDTAVNGVADMNDPFRDIDRIDSMAKIDRLDIGRTGLRIREVPGYPEMLDRVCESRRLDLAQFRAYRCRTRYPVYGAQYSFSFPVPRVPSPNETA